MNLKTYTCILFLVLGCWLSLSTPASAKQRGTAKSRPTAYIATAHSEEGTAADGTQSRPGKVAADPSVLPLGSRIRVTGGGKYSGDYTVSDTGSKVNGRHIDIYLPSDAEAKQFGKRNVKVQILQKGEGKQK